MPTLVDNGFVVFESRAILQYLANKYAPGKSIYPSEAQARANVDKILFYDASAFMPSMKAVIVSYCKLFNNLLCYLPRNILMFSKPAYKLLGSQIQKQCGPT